MGTRAGPPYERPTSLCKGGAITSGVQRWPQGSSVCGGRGAQAFRLPELELKRIPRWEDMSALTRIFWVFGSDPYKRGPCRGGPHPRFGGTHGCQSVLSEVPTPYRAVGTWSWGTALRHVSPAPAK